MRIARLAVLPLLLAALTSRAFTQAPASPTFDVVSIKLNTTRNLSGGPPVERPDGGLRMISVPVSVLIARAYPPAVPIEMVGLPDWARTERYDVIATSTLSSATRDDRIAMLRAMLADRLKLVAHVETREQPVYDLVLARRDGRLGPGITPLDVDCDAQMAACAAAAALNAGTPPPTPPPRPDFSAPPPPCTLRTVGAMLRDRGDQMGKLGDLLEGEAAMATLAMALRPWARRPVVNKTGLSGSYRVRMNFEMMAAVRGPDTGAPAPDAAPTIFTAVQEQLGLKLESSRASREVLVIDHLERPTAD
jgi:uncharacterized protein (TIGR03435 family)